VLDLLIPFGDRAYRISHRSSAEASAWAEAVRNALIPGVVDIVTAYEMVAVFLDPDKTSIDNSVERLRAIDAVESESLTARIVVVPAFYDGIDLPDVAVRLGLDVPSVIDAHSSRTYRVVAIGFRPGFPYMEELSDPLCGLPRRTKPRTAVPAGSVAIVGRQTAIYPESSPGGWHLIARTPIPLVDLRAGWFAFRVGDLVRFHPIGRNEFDAIHGKGRADASDGSEC
jgi:KipI family sensor histidine kinase inhibitor